MVFEKKIINLKNDRTCTLRSVEAKDAKAMIEYLRIVSSETPFLLRNEDEVTYTIEADERLLENKRNDPREIMMVAENLKRPPDFSLPGNREEGGDKPSNTLDSWNFPPKPLRPSGTSSSPINESKFFPSFVVIPKWSQVLKPYNG